MNHIRSTQHIDEKKNKINYTIILNQKTFIAILIEKLVHAKHHKNHNKYSRVQIQNSEEK